MTAVGPYQSFYFVLNGDEEINNPERGWKVNFSQNMDNSRIYYDR